MENTKKNKKAYTAWNLLVREVCASTFQRFKKKKNKPSDAWKR